MLLSQENWIEHQNSVSGSDYQANIAYYRGNQRRNWQSNFNNSGNASYQSGRQYGTNSGGGNVIQLKINERESSN